MIEEVFESSDRIWGYRNITKKLKSKGVEISEYRVRRLIFFASLKKEKIYRRKYDTMEGVKKDVFWYIELFYNRKRRHSTLQYMTPVEYLRKYEEMKVA